MSGVTELNALKEGGFSEQEIKNYTQTKSQDLINGGFSINEVNNYFGIKEPDTTLIEEYWKESVNEVITDKEYQSFNDPNTPFATTAQLAEKLKLNLWGADNNLEPLIRKKLGDSTVNTALNIHLGKGMEMNLPEPEKQGFGQKLIGSGVSMIAEIPTYGAGFAIGSIASGGNPFAGLFASGFTGATIQEMYAEMREKGEVQNFSEFWNLFLEKARTVGIKEGIKFYAGGAATKFLGPLSGSVTANTLAFNTSLTGIGVLLGDNVPDAESFLIQNILTIPAGFSFAKQNIREAVKKTGKSQLEIYGDMLQDPTIREDVLAVNTKGIRAYKDITEQKPVEEVKPKIIERKKPIDIDEAKLEESIQRDPIKRDIDYQQVKNDFLYYGYDKYNIFKQVTDKAKELGVDNFRNNFNPYENLITQKGLVSGIADHNINIGTLDSFKNSYEKIGPSLKERIGKIESERDLYKIDYILKSKRAIEKSSQGFETGVDLTAAKNFIKKNPDLLPKQKLLVEYQQTQLKNYKDAGMLEEKGFKAMIEANKDYVTFDRVFDEKVKDKSFGSAIVNPIKLFKGSERKTYSPLESIVNTTRILSAKAETNIANTAMIDLILKVNKAEPGSFFDVKLSEKRTRETRVTKEELVKAGIDIKNLSNEVLDAFSVYRKEQGYLKPTEIQIYRNGKREVYEVGSDFARGFKDIDKTVWSDIAAVIGFPTKLLRSGATTFNPEFMYNNLPRDAFSSAILSKTWHPPFYAQIQGAALLIKPIRTKLGYQPMFEKWVKSGGMKSTFASLDRNYFQAGYKEIFTGIKFRNIITKPVEMIRVAAEASEYLSRLGNFKLSYLKYIKEGYAEKIAIRKAGYDATINPVAYARAGATVKQVNLISAFFNARIQSLGTITEAFKERPLETTAKSVAWISLLSVYNWIANHDDPDYQKLPEWRKDLSWNFKIKSSSFEDGYFYFPVPKPFELGLIFGTGTEKLLDFYVKEDPAIIKDFIFKVAGDTAKSFIPIPDIIKPAVENWSNKSLFTGKPIIPDSLKNLPSEYQFTDYTSETAKLIGKGIRFVSSDDFTGTSSPVVIDNAIRSWTGGVGTQITKLIDQVLISSGTVDDPIKPETKFTDIFFVKAFVVRNPDRNSQFVTDFYKEYNQIQKRQSAVENFKKTGDLVSADIEEAKLPKNYIDLEIAYKAIRDKENQMRNIMNSKGYGAEEKRHLIDGLINQIIIEAEYGLKRFKQK
jgi:hypothetical protein